MTTLDAGEMSEFKRGFFHAWGVAGAVHLQEIIRAGANGNGAHSMAAHAQPSPNVPVPRPERAPKPKCRHCGEPKIHFGKPPACKLRRVLKDRLGLERIPTIEVLRQACDGHLPSDPDELDRMRCTLSARRGDLWDYLLLHHGLYLHISSGHLGPGRNTNSGFWCVKKEPSPRPGPPKDGEE